MQVVEQGRHSINLGIRRDGYRCKFKTLPGPARFSHM